MFSASWCAPCHRIKNEIFTHPKIAQIVNENYLAYWVDIESFDGLEVNNTFRVSQLPTLLFFDPKGNPIDKAIGYFDGYYLFKKFRAHIPPAQRNVEWEHNIEGE
jgi:thioredoxin-related protein